MMPTEAGRARRQLKDFEQLGTQFADASGGEGPDGPNQEEQRIIRKANNLFLEELFHRFLQSQVGLRQHRRRLAVTYWIYVGLAVLTFLAGLALLAVPIIQAQRGDVSAAGVGLGVAGGVLGTIDVAVFLLANPLKRIERMMGDMSQLLTILDNHVYQIGLRLVEFDVTDKASIDGVAGRLQEATVSTSEAIQEFFEDDDADDQAIAQLLQRIQSAPRAQAASLLPDLPLRPRTIRRLRTRRLIPSSMAKRLLAEAKAQAGGVKDPADPPATT